MPYALQGTTVVNRATGAPVPGGKHGTRAKALAHLRALMANVSDAKANDQSQYAGYTMEDWDDTKPDSFYHATKDYSAHVGQVIAGRLVRGAGGKFSSGGAAAPASERVPFKALPKAPKHKKGKVPKKGKRAAARGGKRAAPKAPKAPKAPRALKPRKAASGGGAKKPTDHAALGRVIAQALQQVGQGAKPKKAGGGGKKRTPRTPRPPPAQSSRPVKLVGGGGGGGGSKAPAHKPEKPTTAISQALLMAAQALSDGGTLSQEDADALVRNGLARRHQDGTLVLTARGLTAISRKSFTVFKDANGSWRWIARTTTAFEDRDNEVISTKALDADVTRADGDGKYGPLRWWHMGRPNPLDVAAPWGPGVDLGWCDFNAMSGKTLIESGTFKSEAIARAVASKADDLELSPGFFHAANEPDQTGVFTHIHRFERSLVPKWAGRASNPYTGLIVQGKETMDEKKIQALKDLGIPEATINALVADVQQTEKAAEADNVRYKEASPIKDFFVSLLRGDPIAATKEDEPPAAEAAPEAPAEPEAAPDPIAALKAELETLRAEVATLKAPPDGMGDMMPDAETPVETDAEAGIEEPADTAGGLTLSAEDLSAVGEIIRSLLEPLIGALGITQKLEGHLGELKTMMGGYVTKKDADEADRQNEVAALKASIDQQQAKLAELIGSEPRAGYRASEAPDNVLNPQVLAAIKDNGDASGTDFSDIAQQLFPGMIRR